MPDRPRRSSGRRPEPQPKPFGKVLITRRPSRNRIMPHDRFGDKSYTGRLICKLTAHTPIHVGSGIYELISDNPVRGLITTDGRATISGTSLKGAIRSVAEAISDSCVRITKREIENNLAVRDVRPCEEIISKHRQPGHEKGSEPQLCVCCSLFGALGYQGRVSFTDTRWIKGHTAVHHIQSPYPPRESARFYKDAHKGRFNGRKFYYHGEPVATPKGEPYQVITKDSELEFTMHFESLSTAEFCLVLVAMGILDDIIIKVGGGKQAMLGSVEIVPTCLEIHDPGKSFRDFSDSGQAVEVIEEGVHQHLPDTVGEASTLINETALKDLMRIWEWPSSRQAPTGIY